METTFDPEYANTESTYGILWRTSASIKLPIVDERPWYRRWWFGASKIDGEWQFGLGLIAVRWPFVRS